MFVLIWFAQKMFAQSVNLTRIVCTLANRRTGMVCASTSRNNLRNLLIVQEWCAQYADRVRILCEIFYDSTEMICAI